MIWIIVGGGLPEIRIHANRFDEALRKARLRDPRYCGGYLADDD